MTGASQLFRSVAIFADLPEHDVTALTKAATRLRFMPGESLICQGESGNDLYVVTEGRFQVSRHEDGRDVQVGEVLPGECVGEVAVLRNVERTATVTAMEDSATLAVPGKLLRKLMDSDSAFRDSIQAQVKYIENWTNIRRYRPSRDETVGQLSHMLPGVSTELLIGLEPQLQWTAVPRGTIVMKQGEVGDHLYFVVSGRLSVFAMRDDGGRFMLGDIGPGESVGEMAMLSNGPRTATVQTATDCELLRLSKVGFDSLLAHDPAASATLAKMMAARLQERLRARSFVSQLRTVPLVTQDDCADVVTTPHLTLRNLKVTETYYRLSIGMTLLTGHQDVSWLTFACHASKTVGTFIRIDEVPVIRMAALVGKITPELPIVNAFRARLSAAVAKVAVLMSEGNIKVFGEIGPVLARMTAEFNEAREHDRVAFDRFLRELGLRSGPSDAGGQDTLREALVHYYDAMFQPDPKRKAELILLANFKVGLHEQIRLQPNIEGAMNALLTEGVFDALGSWPLVAVVREPMMLAWRIFATRTMMSYRLPYGAVSVSGAMPLLPTRRIYPDLLTDLDNPELRAVARRYGATLGRNWLTSRDWANLEQRMTFIFELFRTRQKSLELFDPPFLREQRLAIATDQLPTGSL